MAKYITLKIEDEAYEQLKLHTKYRIVWLGSPTGDWGPIRAFLGGSDFEPKPLGRNLDVKLGNITFVDDETFDNLRQAAEEVIRSAFQAGAAAMNAEDYIKNFQPTSYLGLKDLPLYKEAQAYTFPKATKEEL